MADRASGLAVTLAILLLPGCIPTAGQDYRIANSAGGASYASAPVETLAEPVIVPEREIVAQTPSWSPAAVNRNARRVEAQSYIVKGGDTLFGIAAATGAGATAIAEANALIPPYMLKTGQRLQIPAGRFHRVGVGETGIAIARAYGINWLDVVALNRIPPPYTLQIGQNLQLPDGDTEAAPPRESGQSPEARAAAFSLDIDSIVTGGAPARAASAPARIAPAPAGFAGSFAWPVAGNVVSRFGTIGGGRVNDGIKIAAPSATPVGAAGDGVVVYAGNEIAVLGGLVLVDHGGGWITAYGHLASLDVAKGQRVKRGQRLGGVGETGHVDSPQLHFEIRKDRRPLDPLTRLPGR
jgi:murein DD-endopeptidase MepM/ murein hydrolase activator NlpD